MFVEVIVAEVVLRRGAHFLEEHDAVAIPRAGGVVRLVQAGVALRHARDEVGAPVALTHTLGIWQFSVVARTALVGLVEAFFARGGRIGAKDGVGGLNGRKKEIYGQGEDDEARHRGEDAERGYFR